MFMLQGYFGQKRHVHQSYNVPALILMHLQETFSLKLNNTLAMQGNDRNLLISIEVCIK